MVPEEHRDVSEPVRPVGVPPSAPLQNLLVRREPLKSALARQSHGVFAHASFGGPQPHGFRAKHPAGHLPRFVQMSPRVVRQLRHIQQQGQNRVRVWRSHNLHPGELLPCEHNPPGDIAVKIQQLIQILRGVPVSFRAQLPDELVVHERVHP